MALTVEDGSIVSGADTYISATGFETYASDRGYTISGTSSQLLLRAMLYVEALNFKGYKESPTQPLQWPRAYVVIDGYEQATNTIPQLLKDLQCEVALAIDAGDDPTGTIERGVKREKVDVIEVEYMDNAAPFSISRKVKQLEKKLVKGGGGMVVELFRA